MPATGARFPEDNAREFQLSDDDRALVARLLRKDEAAFLSLVDKLHRPMLRVSQSMVPSRAVAEEVVQETWQAVITGLPAFEGRSSLRTWVFHILVNRARTRSRQEYRSIPVPGLTVGHLPKGRLVAVEGQRDGGALSNERATPERAVLDDELRARVEAAIETLPHPMQEVLIMRDVAGCSSAEICNALVISETNQRVLLHRARLKVRAALVGYLEGGS